MVNTSVSLSIQISLAKWFSRAWRWTVCPFNNRKNSFHLTSPLLQGKSFNNITSKLSAPTHPYLSLAGFENVLKMISNGRSLKKIASFSSVSDDYILKCGFSFTQKITNPFGKNIWVNTVFHQYLVSTSHLLTSTDTFIFLIDFFCQVHPAHISFFDFFRSSL